MGKSASLTVYYREGELPESLGTLLGNADETDLRVLVCALLLCGRQNGRFTEAEITECLGLAKAETDGSLKFWRGAGVIGPVRAKAPSAAESARGAGSAPAKPSASSESAAPSAPVAAAHRNGVVERRGLGSYTTDELSELLERRRVSGEFIDEAQRVMGKIFRSYDTAILVGMVDQLGFSEEAVLTILTYAVERGRKTLRYAEQLAIALYDEGVTETGAVFDRISRMERAQETVGKLRQLFGVGSRELTATEKRLFALWTETYAYDLEVIRLAYDITVDNTGKAAPKYTNGILEKWYAQGLRSAEEVRRYIEADREKRSETKAGELPKSYDMQDFFDAALRRSYEELE